MTFWGTLVLVFFNCRFVLYWRIDRLRHYNNFVFNQELLNKQRGICLWDSRVIPLNFEFFSPEYLRKLHNLIFWIILFIDFINYNGFEQLGDVSVISKHFFCHDNLMLILLKILQFWDEFFVPTLFLLKTWVKDRYAWTTRSSYFSGKLSHGVILLLINSVS